MTENPTTQAILEFLNTMETAITKARDALGLMQPKQPKPSGLIGETSFTALSYEKQTGAKIGEYEVAHKKANLPEKWTHAHNVLRQNNATISQRYHIEGYTHGYWLYGQDKIYRQKLKTQ